MSSDSHSPQSPPPIQTTEAAAASISSPNGVTYRSVATSPNMGPAGLPDIQPDDHDVPSTTPISPINQPFSSTNVIGPNTVKDMNQLPHQISTSKLVKTHSKEGPIVMSPRESVHSTTAPAKKPYEVSFTLDSFSKKMNYIRTTKYTILTFIPLNLWFQFHRFYNIYFLCGALSVIGGYSSLSPMTQISPLLIVLAFSAVKDGIEDFSRYRQDQKANTVLVDVIRNGKREKVLSMHLMPGDILAISKGDKSPVDGIFLSTSYEDGTAFIETAELDGETNLKRRTAPTESAHLTTDESVSKLKGLLQCEHPNENLLSYEGRMTFKIDGGEEQDIPLTMNNLILRGAVLRNTEHAYILVVYSGNDTKIIRNLKQSGVKSSTLERRLNWLVVAVFGYNIILLVSSVLLSYFKYLTLLDKENANRAAGLTDYAAEWYLGPRRTNRVMEGVISFISFFGIYTYVIPISLFVTMELARLAQAIYISWDKKMVYEYVNHDGEKVRLSARTNNSNLNEDLGCIDYIFSDKTGTLTQNSMRMAKWYVAGIKLDEMKTQGILARQMADSTLDKEIRKKMLSFGLALSLCHGVIPAMDEKRNQLVYESQSPDETALLIGVKHNGIKLLSRTKSHMEVQVLGDKEQFEILNVLEFTSARKRMSVIIRKDGVIRLYCKGADNIIFERCSEACASSADVKNAKQALIDFSNEGLRTLVIAQRTLKMEQYEAFRQNYEVAERSLDDREQKLADACEMVECELEMLGCTAIEDRLQDLVPETIEYILKAGIKLWLLTGDKQETAINIGMSSRLITSHMKLLRLNASSKKETISAMDKILEDMDAAEKANEQKEYALVVNGDVLAHVFAGEHKSKFLAIGTRCHSVICCRVTPLQKALVVRLVRNSIKTAVTLAIGDGANDVSMIQEAHVGVGIMGKEGTQAVRAADYAFGEFRFLSRLMAVHGRFNYLRMSNLIFYSFYKNFAMITVQWWFGFFSGWSGQSVYEEIFFTAYNIVFTSLPPFLMAVFERDVRSDQIEKYPQLYREVAKGLYWNSYQMVRWLVSSIIHSLFIFGIVHFTNQEGVVDITGKSTGFYVQAFLFSTPLLLTVTSRIAIITKHWVWPVCAGLVFSIGINIVIMFLLLVLENFVVTDFGSSIITHALPAYYMLCVLMPAICVLPDLFFDYIQALFWPTDANIIMEESKLKETAERRNGRKLQPIDTA